jgi:hypothetical protein
MGLFRNHFQLNSARSPVRSRLRPFSSTRSTHPSTILIGRSPWKPIIARDACGRWSVAGLTSAWRCPCQAFWWSGHAPVTNVAGNCVPSVRTGRVGIHPQSNAGVVENVQLVLPGVRLVVRVDVSVAAIRRRPNTSLPGWPSRRAERCDTRSQRHSQHSERRNASSAEAAGWGRRQRGIVDGAQ